MAKKASIDGVTESLVESAGAIAKAQALQALQLASMQANVMLAAEMEVLGRKAKVLAERQTVVDGLQFEGARARLDGANEAVMGAYRSRNVTRRGYSLGDIDRDIARMEADTLAAVEFEWAERDEQRRASGQPKLANNELGRKAEASKRLAGWIMYQDTLQQRDIAKDAWDSADLDVMIAESEYKTAKAIVDSIGSQARLLVG